MQFSVPAALLLVVLRFTSKLMDATTAHTEAVTRLALQQGIKQQTQMEAVLTATAELKPKALAPAKKKAEKALAPTAS